MNIGRKDLAAFLAAGLLLIVCGCAGMAGEDSPPTEAGERAVALTASFQQEDGTALCGSTIRLSLGEDNADHTLDSSGELRVSGLPRDSIFTLSILDRQEQIQSTMPLAFSQGAVIDAVTDESGTGRITLKEDTEEIALAFVLTSDGSLQCALRLAQPSLPSAAASVKLIEQKPAQ